MDSIRQRQFPNPADHESLWHIEIRERAIEARIERIGVLTGARTKARGQVDRLRYGVGGSQREVAAKSFVHSQLKLIAVRESVTGISE